MNKRRKKLEPKYIALIGIVMVITLIAVLSYSLKDNKKLTTFESIIKDVTTEVQKVVYLPFKNFGSMIKDYNSLKNVLKENKILKSNVEKIESLETENTELKKEIQELKKELN